MIVDSLMAVDADGGCNECGVTWKFAYRSFAVVLFLTATCKADSDLLATFRQGEPDSTSRLGSRHTGTSKTASLQWICTVSQVWIGLSFLPRGSQWPDPKLVVQHTTISPLSRNDSSRKH